MTSQSVTHFPLRFISRGWFFVTRPARGPIAEGSNDVIMPLCLTCAGRRLEIDSVPEQGNKILINEDPR
jgi:hypothetical protein